LLGLFWSQNWKFKKLLESNLLDNFHFYHNLPNTIEVLKITFFKYSRMDQFLKMIKITMSKECAVLFEWSLQVYVLCQTIEHERKLFSDLLNWKKRSKTNYIFSDKFKRLNSHKEVRLFLFLIEFSSSPLYVFLSFSVSLVCVCVCVCEIDR